MTEQSVVLLLFWEDQGKIEIFKNHHEPLLENTKWLWKSVFAAVFGNLLNEFNLKL